MKKGLMIKLATVILSMALIFTMTVPVAAFGATTTKAPAAPKITSCQASGNTVTIKWSKVKGADFYKVYQRTSTKEWKYLKSVKKTAKNKKKYSNTSKYKLKVTKSGKKYKVYKKTTVYKYKQLKKTTKRTYTFKGKYNKKYTFVVKAHKGKKYSKYSKAKTVRTDSKGEDVIVWPPVDEDDPDDWDRNKEAEYVEILQNEMGQTTQNVRIAALELYKKLAWENIEKGENNMVSPVSFFAAMGMLENGAKGETLSEIEAAFGNNIQDFNDWFVNWYNLAELKGKTLKLADSVWVRDDDKLVVVQDFQDKLDQLYKAQFFKEPFDQETTNKINSWVNEHTDQMIPKVIDELSKDTVMALINATCFRGKWVEPFMEEATVKDKPFTREDGSVVKADYMRSNENRYIENDFVTGTFKQYRKGYKIMFLLPKEGVTVKEALENLKGDDLYKLEQGAKSCSVNLTVPKFNFDYTAPDCIDSLNKMGITKVFDGDQADLSGMASYDEGRNNLFVSNIIHKTHIDLHEKGTDAAAVTAILIDKATSAPGQEFKEVTLNRPFIFVISDNATSTPIFVGTVQTIG